MSVSKIHVARVKATARHRTKATIHVPNDEGVVEPREINIFYRGLSMNDSEEFPEVEGLEGEARNEAVRKQLAFFVLEIPEFTGDDDAPVKIDEGFLKELDIEHVSAISKAIQEARAVPTSPTAS